MQLKTFARFALTVLVATGAKGGDSAQSALQKTVETYRENNINHLRRVDERRLLSINRGLDLIVEEAASGTRDRDVLRGLASVEASLFGLRLAPQKVALVHARIECIRSSLQIAGMAKQCPANVASIETTASLNPNSPTVGLAQTSRAVGLQIAQDTREPYAIAFYGHSVDRDIGEFFARLARVDPSLLQPIPIDSRYQFANCINGGYAKYVSPDPDRAESLFRETLSEVDELQETSSDAFRFTLIESQLAERKIRSGAAVPDRLADFTLEDAVLLITTDFTKRFGLEELSEFEIAPLRNLWSVVLDEMFLKIIEEATGVKRVAPNAVGKVLESSGLRGRALWSNVFLSAGQTLDCNDANEVFKAYGLVYRQGHYETAKQVLDTLRRYLGYRAVPGVAVSQSTHSFLEGVPQSCVQFGPVEALADGVRSDDCNLRELTVDGRKKYEVLAGGAAIQFFATREQQETIRDAILAMEDLRKGDILRWRESARVELSAQTTETGWFLRTEEEARKKMFPCVVSLSQSRDFSSAADLQEHVENYREHFYLKGDPLFPEALSYVFVLDQFVDENGKDLSAETQESIAEFSHYYSEMAQMVDDQTLPENQLDPVCQGLAIQLKMLGKKRHGEFIRSLLIGGKSPIFDGVGILNPRGEFEAKNFELMKFRNAENDLSTVVDEINSWRDVFDRSGILNEVGETRGVSVFNISLGNSYRDRGTADKDRAKRALKSFKDATALWETKALFVVAAGQPEFVDEDTRGIELNRISAHDANVDSGCHFFPACLSERHNIITVGALQPNAGIQRHELPVLIEWANYGSAVSVAAPGAGVLSNEYGYLKDTEGAGKLKQLTAASVRDGTSVSTVFVTALAARLAAEYPQLNARQIKKRLIATARAYVLPENAENELFAGEEGQLFAGAIDPVAAMRDPGKLQVVWRTPPTGIPKVEQFEFFSRPSSKSLVVFSSDHELGIPRLKCGWANLLRIHIEDEYQDNDGDPPLYRGAMACTNQDRQDLTDVAFGWMGTRKSHQQHRCIIDRDCFKAVREGEEIVIDLSEVHDIYFPVEGQ